MHFGWMWAFNPMHSSLVSPDNNWDRANVVAWFRYDNENAKAKNQQPTEPTMPHLSPIYTSSFSLTSLPWQVNIARVDGK